MARFTDYDHYDALGLAKLVRERQVSAVELVEECIARIEQVNPRIHAVVTPMYERARAAAARPPGEGPFDGVPFLLKDLLTAVRGVRFTSGSRYFRDYVPDHDSELVLRYRRAGLIAVGKTNTPELGLLPATEPSFFGPTDNPWEPSRTAGGSSGGSAAAVAAGIVPMAHGGDGGGSIRIPSSCCGVFGLKPTRARTPAGPDASQQWFGFVLEHVLTRSVRDSAAALDATTGVEPTAPYHVLPPGRPFLHEVGADPGKMRIGFFTTPPLPAEVHPDCVAATEDAARLCESLGHHVEELHTRFDSRRIAHAFFTVIGAATAADLHDAEVLVGRPPAPDDFEPETQLTAMFGRVFTAADLAIALHTLEEESRRLAVEWADYDAVLTPTLAQPPVLHGALRAKGIEETAQRLIARAGLRSVLRLPGLLDQAIDRVFSFIPFPPVANYTGRPSMSVPLYWNERGLPIGVMFTARFGDEAALLRLAAQLEAARPWFDRRPPVRAGLAD